MAKSKHNSIKKMKQTWSSLASNNSYNQFHWDEYQKPEPIKAIVDGWKFTLFNNKHVIRLEAVSETTSCGIGIKVSAYMNTPFGNDAYKWAYKVMQPDDTATDSEKKEENRSGPEHDVCFDVAIKSMDDSYQKWFDVWSINSVISNNTAKNACLWMNSFVFVVVLGLSMASLITILVSYA